MCGFLCEISFNNKLSSLDNFKVLLELSKHRGPDDTQILVGENYKLGFNRLSILDISANGSQPKQSASKRYSVVFNGEIYNYQALAKAYQLTDLKSTSDTEVLVHLMDKIGVKNTVEQLNGMFSILIVDSIENCTYLIRDFAGIKPLFYGINKAGLVAASQFDQVFKHPFFKAHLQLRPEVVKAYFGFGYMQAPDTIYQNIFQVNPGELIKISATGTIEKQLYYTIKTRDVIATNNFSELNTSIENAVKIQLVSDVPLGTFLSGGIDSPLITAIAKKHKSDIEAFTLSVNDATLDEAKKAEAYAKFINCKQHISKADEDIILKDVDAHFKYLPEPFGDYSSIPTYLITKLAAQKNTVMLSGDGGDELFFGYPRMLQVINLRHWFKIPFGIRKPLIRLFNKLGWLKSWGPYHSKTLSDYVLQKHSYIKTNTLNSIFKNANYPQAIQHQFKFESNLSKVELLSRLRENEFYGHLQRVLVKVDRMSMANSLEVRVPFLDKNVIEKAFQFVPERFESKKDLKKVLKDYLSDFFPKELIDDKKQGFAVPIEDWLRNELKADVEKHIFKLSFYGSSYLNFDIIKTYVNDFYDGKHNEAWGVWHIYAWQKWAVNHNLI